MRTLLDLSSEEAKDFFISQDCYCNFDLPDYFDFRNVLEKVDKSLEGARLTDVIKNVNNRQVFPSSFNGVNYTLLSNKTGRLSWRPLQIINPALYVLLVDAITNNKGWSLICDRFKLFQGTKRIVCCSIPIYAKNNFKMAQVLNWYNSIEQSTIINATKYRYVLITDIANCYPSMYTHSIPWALHGQSEAKSNKRNRDLIGNTIDQIIQSMSFGQTNGIPQGSVVMDFIAEIILGYIDTKISVALEKLKISDYQILRYRDDYRIFSNNSRLLEEISQTISSVLIDFGMQLNDAKTTISSDLIYSAMKEDKWQKIRERLNFDNYRERLLWIYDFAKRNHNSGSLISALTDFNEILGEQRLSNLAKKEIIAVVSEIAYNNHKTYPIIAAILSKMFYALPKGEVKTIAKRVIGRLNNLTNSGHFQVWLQRSLIFTDGEYAFGEQLCKKLSDKRVQLWNVAWLRTDLAKMISRDSLIDIVKLNNINPIIPSSEIRTFKIIRRHSE